MQPHAGSLCQQHSHSCTLTPSKTFSAACRRGSSTTRCRALHSLELCKPQDLLVLITDGGTQELVEVMQGWDATSSSAVLAWKGQLLQLAAQSGGDAGSFSLTALGGFPTADSTSLTAFPELARVLPQLHSHAGPVSFTVQSAEVVDSLEQLRQQVQAAPGFWCDGTAPGDPVKSELQQALFTAGELEALVAGHRGVCLVQLWNGWDPSRGQPLYQPFVLTMLERALAAPGVGHLASVAPGGVGLTAVLYADREPFASWAAHLASFGCQANVVAGSAYYKLLIGLLLGYKEANVLGYVAASGEPASQQLQQQVAADIRSLSKVKPRLPWSPDDTNIRRPKQALQARSTAAAKSGGKGFGSKPRR